MTKAEDRDARRMTLSEMLNTEAHGHIHELIGGSWSEEYGRVTMGVTDAVLPFLHTIQVSMKSSPWVFV